MTKEKYYYIKERFNSLEDVREYYNQLSDLLDLYPSFANLTLKEAKDYFFNRVGEIDLEIKNMLIQ